MEMRRCGVLAVLLAAGCVDLATPPPTAELKEAAETGDAGLGALAADGGSDCPRYEDADWSNALYGGDNVNPFPDCLSTESGEVRLHDEDRTNFFFVNRNTHKGGSNDPAVEGYGIRFRMSDMKPSIDYVVGGSYRLIPPWSETTPKSIRVLVLGDSIFVPFRTIGWTRSAAETMRLIRTGRWVIVEGKHLPFATGYDWTMTALGECTDIRAFDRKRFCDDEIFPDATLSRRGREYAFWYDLPPDLYFAHYLAVDDDGWSSTSMSLIVTQN